MARYSTYTSTLLDKRSQSTRYEKIARTLYHTQAAAGVFEANDIPKVQVPLPLWEEAEAKLSHDIAGWVAAWREQLPTHLRPYTYLGLTSSNLVDTARAMEAREVYTEYSEYLEGIDNAVQDILDKLQGTLREGRTHGQYAHPVYQTQTYMRFLRDIAEALADAARSFPWGSLSGPTGNPNQRVLPPEVRADVGEALGVQLDPHASQISSRLRLLAWCQAIYRAIAACEQLSLYHRLESLPEIGRFRETFDNGTQKGSSSMPHKNNPARSERICGLARVARGYLATLSESATSMWWERDLSNSSAERIAYTGLLETAAFVFQETQGILESSAIVLATDLPDQVWSHHHLVSQQLQAQDPDIAYYDIQRRNQSNGQDNV